MICQLAYLSIYLSIYLSSLKFSSKISIFLRLLRLCSVIYETTEPTHRSMIKKMLLLEEIFNWHLEAFASELFICMHVCI